VYALDSDVLIAFLHNDADARNAIQRAQDVSAYVTVLNMQEVLAGAKNEKTREKVTRFLAAFPSIPYTHNEVAHVVDIRHDLARRGTPIGLMDEMIAGIVQANDLTLITRNRKHFAKIKGLKIKTW
jgi:predicted nucleic acid-binding protein